MANGLSMPRRWSARTTGCDTPRAAKDEIVVLGHQYYWDFTYPNGAISVDRLRLPLNRTVRLTIRSSCVDHGFTAR